MGYGMHLHDNEFFMKEEDKKSALHSLKKMVPGKYRWTHTDDFKDAHSFGEAMEAWRWAIHEDDDGNVDDIEFEGENAGDDLVMFKVIAPFVKKGSYIEMVGEEGDRWRWVFDGGMCEEVKAKISW